MSYNTKNYAAQGGSEWVVNGRLKIKGSDIAAIVDGNCYYVDSVSGSDSNSGENWDEALATIDHAIGHCTANNGDRIYVASGHAENVATAGAIACDVAGIEIVGVGEGNDRPKLTFTGTGGSILITAASTKIVNLIGIAGIDGITNPFNIQAADCVVDCEWRDASSTVEAVRAVLANASADRLKVILKYLGQTGGDACVNAIRLTGVDNADIVIDFYGKVSTGVVEMITTQCTNINVTGRSYNSGTSDFSKLVVDTGGINSTWSWKGWDGEACCDCSGGQDAAIAADDSSADISAVNSYVLVQTSLDRSHMKVWGDRGESYMVVLETQGESYTKVESDAGMSYTLVDGTLGRSHMKVWGDREESYMKVLSDLDESYMKVEADAAMSYDLVQSTLDRSHMLVSKDSEESFMVVQTAAEVAADTSYTLVQATLDRSHMLVSKDSEESYMLVLETQGESYTKVESDAAMSFVLVDGTLGRSHMKVWGDREESFMVVQTAAQIAADTSYMLLEAGLNQSYMLVKATDIIATADSYMKVESDLCQSYMKVQCDLLQSMILLLPST